MVRILTLSVISLALLYGQSNSTIEGVVRDSTGAPISEVTISLSNTGAEPAANNPALGRIDGASATTDFQGKFTLETNGSGRLRVFPSKNGYIFVRPGQKTAAAQPGVWVQLSAGDHVKDVDLTMAKPGVISGRVLDVNGNPIVGTAVNVALVRYTYRSDGTRELGPVPGIEFPRAVGPSVTLASFVPLNDKGEFRLYDLPPGEYYLRVSDYGGAIGGWRSYYYPGVSDETKAVPIAVSSGDDIRLGTLSLPSRDTGVEVKLHTTGIPATPGRSTIRIFIADIALAQAPVRSDEIVLSSVAPGHYDFLMIVPPNLYATATLDVGLTRLEQEIVLKPKARVTGRVLIEDETGNRSPAPGMIRCMIRSRYELENCVGSQVAPGLYQFDLQGLPPDLYLQSAKIGDRDVLTGELNITGDTTLDVILAASGAIVDGIVRSADGRAVANSAVVLVPDSPFDKVLVRYRSVIADSNGKYEIHGVAPGSYKIYAWPELDGFAYRNAEFMKEFSDRGTPLRVEKKGRASVDLTAF